MNSFGGGCGRDRLFGGEQETVEAGLRWRRTANRRGRGQVVGSDAFELRAVNAARTSTAVEYKLGEDVNRLRSDVFVLRVLRCLTFEVRRDRRRDARPGRKDDMPHLEAGPGGLPLGLASTDGLGGTMPIGAAKACVLGSLPSGRR